MKAILGGTFNELHRGHESLLQKAIESADENIIGLTSDSFARVLGKNHSLRSFDERKKDLEEFMKSRCKNFKIIEIQNMFGPTLEMEDLDIIVVSEETQPNAELINKERVKRGLKPLEVSVIPMVRENGKKVSSG